MKYLITNADDYGYRSDISQALVSELRTIWNKITTIEIQKLQALLNDSFSVSY